MKKPTFCPNPECVHHNAYQTNPKKRWYSKDGFYHTKAFGTIQRYKCRTCKIRFSDQTFSINYYVKKPVDHRTILQGLVTTSNLSDAARQLQVSVNTIINRHSRLAKQAVALHSQLLSHITLNEPFVCDGFQSVCVNFYYPNNINIAIGKNSQFFYSFTYATVKRGGKLTAEQKLLRSEYENRWSPQPLEVKHSFSDLLDTISFVKKQQSKTHIFLFTDKKTDYPVAISEHTFFQALTKENLFTHIKISGKAPRTLNNPLFPVNYMDMLFRKDLSEHVTKTICFSRNVNNQMVRMAIYRFYHNYIKKFRARNKFYTTHSDKTGIPPHLRKTAVRRFFTERVFLTHYKNMESDMKILRREYTTPLKKSEPVQFLEKWCA